MKARDRKRVGDARAETAASEARSEKGQPLDQSARGFFEQAFQHDFSQIRVHDGAEAARTAASADAAAVAAGSDLLFDEGVYEPESARGRYVLAHELAHVVQFDRLGGGRDALPFDSDPGDSAEQDAHRAAAAVTAGEVPNVSAAPTAVAPAFLGGLWDVLSGQESKPTDEPSFMKDVVGRTLWGGATDDTIGGLTDIAALKNIGPIGEGMRGAADPTSKVLGPLSVLSGGIDMYTGITGERNFENNEKSVLGLGNVLSGLASTAGLFGVGGGVTGATAMTGAGLAEAGAGAVGGVAGAGLAAGGQVIGAGLAGYGAGKLMDKGIGWLGEATTGDKRGLSDRMVDRAMITNEAIDKWTGSDTAGDIVGGIQLGAESLVSPIVGGVEAALDVGSWAGTGIANKANDAMAWMDQGIRGLYGVPSF